MISIIIGIVLLYIGAEGLVRGSSKLAARYGIPPLVIGLTIVAFGTSAPEMTVSVSAALRGVSDVAVGNVVGSNIFNIAVILGLTALIRPPTVHIDLIRREIPFMILISLLAFGLVISGEISRVIGGLLFAGLCAYIVVSLRATKRQEDVIDTPRTPGLSVPLCALFVVLGIGLLVVGAHLFVVGAVELAAQFGVSEAVIALTIVAAGTSLPELATSVVAALKGESDVAIGNVVGSNLFNILGILGVTALIQPLRVSGIGVLDAAFMLGSAILLLPFAFSRSSISRPEACVFLAIYGTYLYLLWPS